MLPLADLQRDFVRAVLDADTGRLAALPLRESTIAPAVALGVYRNTVFGALANALRVTFPTVDKLVGEEFFDHLSAAFVEAHPPSRGALSLFGDGFADFIQTYAPVAELHYLADVARLDHLIDRTLAKPDVSVTRLYALDANVSLEIPKSLCAIRLEYPADQIRDALEAGDDDALGRIDLSPNPHWLVLWRAGRSVMLRAINDRAGIFLSVLLAGSGAEAAFALAAADAAPEAAMSAIQTDIFASNFVRVVEFKSEREFS